MKTKRMSRRQRAESNQLTLPQFLLKTTSSGVALLEEKNSNTDRIMDITETHKHVET